MKYSRMFMFLVLMAAAAASFGAYNAAKPADNEYVADVPALVRENFRAIKDDAIVNAGAVSGYAVGNASGNIPRSNGTLNTNLNADLLDGFHASAFNASDALLLRLDGSRAMTGSLKFSGNYGILQSTSDGADTGYTHITGGGGEGRNRGGGVTVFGNEHSTAAGQIRYTAGNVSTGDHVFYIGAGTERFRIGYDGTLTAAGALLFNGNHGVGRNTADDADNGSLALWGGGGASHQRGSYVQVFGNDRATYGGQLLLYAGNNSNTGHVIFYTGAGSERMRLTYGGNLLISTTTDDGTNKLQVNGGISCVGSLVQPSGGSTASGILKTSYTSLAKDAEYTFSLIAGAYPGTMLLYEGNNGNCAKFYFDRMAAATVEEHDLQNKYSVTKDNSGTINIYYTGSELKMQNKTAATVVIRFTILALIP